MNVLGPRARQSARHTNEVVDTMKLTSYAILIQHLAAHVNMNTILCVVSTQIILSKYCLKT